MTLTAAPTISDDATTYLAAAWWDQPYGAAATDAAYLTWEQAWDQLCRDVEAGNPAALEAVEVIDAEVTPASERRHCTTSSSREIQGEGARKITSTHRTARTLLARREKKSPGGRVDTA